MTGDNFEDVCNFQPEFWPSEWQYGPQREFGAMDAPESLPAGATRRWDLASGYAMPVALAASRDVR